MQNRRVITRYAVIDWNGNWLLKYVVPLLVYSLVVIPVLRFCRQASIPQLPVGFFTIMIPVLYYSYREHSSSIWMSILGTLNWFLPSWRSAPVAINDRLEIPQLAEAVTALRSVATTLEGVLLSKATVLHHLVDRMTLTNDRVIPELDLRRLLKECQLLMDDEDVLSTLAATAVHDIHRLLRAILLRMDNVILLQLPQKMSSSFQVVIAKIYAITRFIWGIMVSTILFLFFARGMIRAGVVTFVLSPAPILVLLSIRPIFIWCRWSRENRTRLNISQSRIYA